MTTAAGHAVDRLDGETPSIVALREQIRRLAAFDAVGRPTVPTLLLQGETGTGKGRVARIVHDSGPRASGPFVPVNCAAIPETMLEAELFGFEAGAFTDARRGKPGLFDAASGGTLFLDEIDSLSLALQSKLLTAIESKRIRRLGAVAEHAVDVKLIAATQADLARLAGDARFRPDLYHRLAVVVLALPPLRERGDDVARLAATMLDRCAAQYGTASKRLGAGAAAWLAAYPWPGNVRELEHLMERVTLLHESAEVGAADLDRLIAPARAEASGSPPPPSTKVGGSGPAPPHRPPTTTGATVGGSGPAPHRPPTTTGAMVAARGGEASDVAKLRQALAETAGNVLRTARLLGVTRDTVRYWMRRHGIERAGVEATAPPAAVPPTSATETGPPARATGAETEAAAHSPAPAPGGIAGGWEEKPVAIVAVELVWPEHRTSGRTGQDPWTEAARWERAIGEKLAGFGGALVQRNPSLLVWVFGLPRALEQVAQRAVHGACAVRNLTAPVTPRDHAPELRAAVHLGAMLMDTAAADPIPGALPVGATLTQPIRLLARTGPGEILLSEDVGRRVEAWVNLEPVDLPGPDGRASRAFRLVGLRSWQERGPERRSRPLRDFVGRDSERDALCEILDVAVTGAGQAVGIAGEPGAGKSRLLYEFHHAIRERPVRYVEAHCLAHATATPYLPIIAILRAYFDLGESDSLPTIADKVRAGLTALDLPADEHLPSLLPLLGAEAEEEDRQQRKAKTFDVVRQMAASAARQRPLVLAIENVHWMDPTSEECLAHLAGAIHGLPLLLVMTYRPGYRPPWLGHAYASQLALRPLSDDASRRLLRSVVGAAALGPEVESQVLSRAEGNPFFLEELGRAVVEHGDEGPQAVPPTVQAALAARIDRLAPEDKRLLQTAAVIGRNVPFALLERVTGQAEPALGPGMARLVAAEFLFEARRRPERAFAFKHALTQAAAYAGLRADARRALHLRVAEALESQASAARPEEVEQFAHHAAEGGAVDKAVASLRRAAAMAAARGARREVVTCYERALGILDRQPAGDAQEDLRDLRFLHAHALYMAGEFPRALRAFGDARAGAEAAGDDRRLSQILAGLSYVHASEGRYAEAAHAGEQALGISMAGDVAVSLWTSFGLARSHFALGNYRRAAECARWGIEALAPWPVDERFGGRAGNLLPAVAAGSWLALALARTGDFDEGTRAGEAAVRAADAVDGLQERVWACYGLGRLHHARTDFARAIALLRRAADLSEGGTVPIYFSRVLSGLGSALYQSGAIDEALPLLERALDDARRMNLLYGHSLIRVQLGEACLAAGRDGEAERHAAQALAFSRERGERGDAAWALLLHGEIAAARGEGEIGRARDWLDQAVAISEEIGMRPLAARSRMARGELELSVGRPREARDWLASAEAELRAMRIPIWLDRTRELLAGLGDR